MKISRPRLYVYLFSIFLILGIYIICDILYPSSNLLNLRLTQTYGFISLFYILACLYISPVYNLFPGLKGRASLVLARRALGITAFVLSLLHSSISFFFILGGFSGLEYLSSNFLLSLSIGLFNLTILTLLAITSFDWMIRKMGHWWKRLHNLIYITAVLVLLHATLIGSHFQDFNNTLAKTFYLLAYIWIVLKAFEWDKSINKKLNVTQPWGICAIIIGVLTTVSLLLLPKIQSGGNPISIHSGHASLSPVDSILVANLNPGLAQKMGNLRTNFYVTFTPSKDLNINSNTELKFKIRDDDSGNLVLNPDILQKKQLKLAIINDDPDYFEVIDVVKIQDQSFIFRHSFTISGRYYLLLTLEQPGFVRQQFDFNLDVKKSKDDDSVANAGNNLQANRFKLTNTGKLESSELEKGNTSFTISPADNSGLFTDSKFITTNFVMVNTRTFQFINTYPELGNSFTFTPFALRNKIEPGLYKIFFTTTLNTQTVFSSFTTEIK